MNNNRNRYILSLVITGCVFIAVNILVFTGSRAGLIAPVDNLLLWGVFATCSVFALLWVTRLLGLQPMVVAVSYAAGGFLAFQGVKLMPNVHVAEIATAGATYGAFGVLVVGGATTKVRMAFFSKQQVPFVVIILGLLLVDALLNSRVSHAGWSVVANALVLPFLLSGVVVGLAWIVAVRVHEWRKSLKKLIDQPEEEAVVGSVESDVEMEPLAFSAPESADEDESIEASAALKTKQVCEAPVVFAESSGVEEEASDDNFFPLEIDNGEAAVFTEEDGSLMDLAAMVAESAPEPVEDEEPLVDQEILLQKLISSEEENELPPEETSVSDSEFQRVGDKPEETISEEEKVDSNDWLSSHLDLLNKLK